MARLLVLIWSLGPMLWQIYTSLRTPAALSGTGGPGWTLANYQQVLQGDPPLLGTILNTATVGATSTALTVLLAVPCAYGLSRMGRGTARPFMVLLAAAAAFPAVLLFVALLDVARQWHLANHLLALSLPYAGLCLPLAVLLLLAAFRDLPADLEEAATLEGMGLWQRLRWVLLPLMAPAMASTAVLVFIFCWNEYPIALTWLSRSDLLTLAPAMARIAGSSVYTIPYGAFAAATVLGSTPLVIVMLLFQRSIISGLSQGAIKG